MIGFSVPEAFHQILVYWIEDVGVKDLMYFEFPVGRTCPRDVFSLLIH